MTGRASVAAGHPVARGREPGPCTVPRTSGLDLAPLDSAVPSARLHARLVAREWGRADLAGDCELIVAELVTNAIRAAREAGGAVPLPIVMRLGERPGGIQVEVWDSSDDLPALRLGQADDEQGGRGLVLVEALAARWGAYRTAGGGKWVWAVLGS